MAESRPDLTAVWEQRESDLLDGTPPGDWQKENEHLKEKFLIGICGNELGGEQDPRRRLYNGDPMQLIIKYAMGHSECTVYRDEMLGGIGYRTSAEFALELDEATAYGEMISRVCLQVDTMEVTIGTLALMDSKEDKEAIKGDAFSVGIYAEKYVGGVVVERKWGSVNCYLDQERILPNRLFCNGADAVRIVFKHTGASDVYLNRVYKRWGTLVYYDPPVVG